MASAFGRLVRMPAADRALLIRTIGLLAVARVALWVLPFRSARRLVTRRPGGRLRPVTLEQVRWAVDVGQRIIPDATCLPQALAAESLLTRGGHPLALRVGVRKSPDGRFDAHAWVESGGYVIVGRLPGGLGEFAPMPPLPPVWSDDPPPAGGRPSR